MDNMVKRHKKEIAKLLEIGKVEKARIKVEHVIRDDFTMEAHELLELLCETVVSRLPLLISEKECPFGMVNAISTLIYAARRVQIPELAEIRKQLVKKYGKHFAQRAELNTDGCVNERVIHKLSVQPPNAFLVHNYLKEIARQYGVDWTPEEPEEAAGPGGSGGGTNLMAPMPTPTGFSVQPSPAAGFTNLYQPAAAGGMPQAPGSMPQGKAPQGYMPQGQVQQGFAPQGYAPQGYAPQGYAPQGYAPQGYVPAAAPGPTYTAQGMPATATPCNAATPGYAMPGPGAHAGGMGGMPTVSADLLIPTNMHTHNLGDVADGSADRPGPSGGADGLGKSDELPMPPGALGSADIPAAPTDFPAAPAPALSPAPAPAPAGGGDDMPDFDELTRRFNSLKNMK